MLYTLPSACLDENRLCHHDTADLKISCKFSLVNITVLDINQSLITAQSQKLAHA